MGETIFVAAIGICLLGLGIWMWWFDNCAPKDEGKKEKKKSKERD